MNYSKHSTNSVLHLTQDGYSITTVYPEVDAEIAKKFEQGRPLLTLAYENDVLIFGFKFGELDLEPAPFCPDVSVNPPVTDGNQEFLIRFALWNSKITPWLCFAKRNLFPSAEFCHILTQAAERQTQKIGFDHDQVLINATKVFSGIRGSIEDYFLEHSAAIGDITLVTLTTGDLFKSNAQLIVNTVNCVGVMGAGLALQFKQRYLQMYANYKHACSSGKLFPGAIHFWRNNNDGMPEWVANFPTKDDWRNPSKLEYIEKGLPELARFVRSTEIESIAMPALGCGLGGLSFNTVYPLIEQTFKQDLPNVNVMVYSPRPK